jgi:ubiquinone/menaquinone biosynthesis C-methylase UbiE
MKLNTVEFHLMNNPVRAWCQRTLEAGHLLALGGRVDGAHALEIGCGRGIGTEIVFERFGAAEVRAFDLDPRMVALAQHRLARFGERVRVTEGDAEHIAEPDASFDAVFDFGIVHHVPDWRRALAEVFRVLRPGGRFFCEEVYPRLISHPLAKRLLRHPETDRFDHAGLLTGLDEAGFRRLGDECWLGTVGWVVADRPR